MCSRARITAAPRHAATQGANTPADAPKRGAEGGAGAGERVTAQEGTELLGGLLAAWWLAGSGRQPAAAPPAPSGSHLPSPGSRREPRLLCPHLGAARVPAPGLSVPWKREDRAATERRAARQRARRAERTAPPRARYVIPTSETFLLVRRETVPSDTPRLGDQTDSGPSETQQRCFHNRPIPGTDNNRP